MESGPGEDKKRREPPRLSPAETAVLSAIDDLIDELGYAPSYSQILARLGWRSKGALHQYLERLRQHGVIAGSGRSLRVVQHPRQDDRSDTTLPNDADSG